MRFLDETTIARLLHYEDLIPAMRQAMIDFSKGRVEQPTRQMAAVPTREAFFAAMPAATADAVGAKLVTLYPGNAVKGLHTHMAVIVLFRPDTGEPLVMMDGRLITEMRTAAVSAAFIDEVAPMDVSRLAILGAGVQGRSHILALSCVRKFDDIRIWNRTAPRAAELASETPGARATSRQEAVEGADVVIVATASAEPVMDGNWLKRGAKVASVGWANADTGELDAISMSNVVVVDSRDGALAESGNVRSCDATIHAELGEVLNGSKPVEPGATVVFDSIGMACEDIVAATLVYGRLRP